MHRDPNDQAATGLKMYIHEIAKELGNETWGTECDVDFKPAMAVIFLRSSVPTLPDRELLLTWDEVNGWAIRVTLDDTGDTTALAYLHHDILATPVEVRTFLRDAKSGRNPGRLSPPYFRVGTVDDDLEARLAQFDIEQHIPDENG